MRTSLRFTRFLKNQDGIALLEFWLVFPFLICLFYSGAEFGRFMLIKQKFEKSAYMIGSIVSQQNPAAKDSNGVVSGINLAELQTNIFPNYTVAMSPFNIENGSTERMGIIVSSLHRDTATNQVQVRWQVGYVAPNSSNNFDWQSSLTGLYVRESGAQKALCTPICKPPAGLTTPAFPVALTPDEINNINAMLPDEGMVVAELYYEYVPIYADVMQGLSTSDAAGMTTPWWLATQKLITHLYLMPRNGPLIYLPPNFPVP